MRSEEFDKDLEKHFLIHMISELKFNFNVPEEINNTIDVLVASNDLDNIIIAKEMLLSCDINL